MIPRIDLPTLIERGRNADIALNIYSDAGVAQSPSAATVVIYDGSEEVVASVAATTVGPPISYTVLAAVTSGRSLSGNWQAIWSVTISGVVYTFQQDIQLVRHTLYPVIIDTDLTDRHSDLDSLRDSTSMTSFAPFRALAWSQIQHKLVEKGNRPNLIMNAGALKHVHVYETLALVFADFASTLGDERYAKLSESYATKARNAWSSLVFKYDETEDGRISSTDQRRGSPVVYLTPPKGWY